jgi:dTDP-4-dehydrorhamnose reductase
MRTLLLGAGGQIGAHVLAESHRRAWPVQAAWYCRPLSGGVALDVRDGEALHDVVADFQPEVIVHAAGMSQADYAEVHAAECRDVTLTGMANVLAAATQSGAAVVFVSNDQIFGECGTPRNETAAAAPMSVHAAALANAEAMLRADSPRHLVVRTACVYGRHDLPRNLVLAALRRLRDGHGVTAARDRHTQPTYAPDLAAALLTLAQRGTGGTVHVVGPDRMTEAAFLKQVAFVHGLDADLVMAVPAAALCEDAPRPLSPWLCRLAGKTLLGSGAVRSVGEGLRTMRDAKKVAVRVAA